MMEIRKKEVENMQEKVKLIRQTFEISINDFANLMGVTRQTIYNIENKKKVLTQTQYLAICSLIHMALKEQPEKEKIVTTILDTNYNRVGRN